LQFIVDAGYSKNYKGEIFDYTTSNAMWPFATFVTKLAEVLTISHHFHKHDSCLETPCDV